MGALRRLPTGSDPLDENAETLLGWAFLLHAAHTRRAGGSLDSASRELGLRPGTLERCSVRLLGWPLARAAESPANVLRARFEEWRDESRAFGSFHPPPPTSVRELAGLLGVEASTLRRHWRSDIPLRCGPKRLLQWAVLLWILDQRRRRKSWGAIATRAGCTRRTMERLFRDLADRPLVAGCDQPGDVRAAFRAWAAETREASADA